ncbi:MAG: hypothetical protein FWB80_08105 [Defluviitaleaceae bacterium]|nr:hypothetical protein [Defluviitaleaceae bacterium]
MHINSFEQDILEYVKDNNIDLYNRYYKESAEYIKIKDKELFHEIYGLLSLELCIERFLLTDEEITQTYESIYDMGNMYQFIKEDYQDFALAENIINDFNLIGKDEKDHLDSEEFAKRFCRKNGVLERLKTYLNFDLEFFAKDDELYRCERAKIIYFIYKIEYEYFPNINVLMLLANPSMENINNSLISNVTKHGHIVKKIKNSLEKELSLDFIKSVKKCFFNITTNWDMYLESIRFKIDALDGNDKYKISTRLSVRPSLEKILLTYVGYKHTPIETLYLIIAQLEQIGQIKDILNINKIPHDESYIVPAEMKNKIKELALKQFDHKVIDSKKIRELSMYVFLKNNTNKVDHKRVKQNIDKVSRWLKFCSRAKPLCNAKDAVSELHIVSCLQAVLLGDGSETFNYVYHGSTKNPQVQAALKNDNPTLDALQIYWVRKVNDYFYSNLGRNKERSIFRRIETICDNILLDIFSCPSIEGMNGIHDFYWRSRECSIIGINNDK